MGLLVGLPLKLFHLLFVLLRLLWPVLLLAVVWWLVRRRRSRSQEPERREKREPHFHGPVYTVDYKVVDEEPEKKDGE